MAMGVILYRYDYRQLQKPHMLQRIMIATLIGMVLVLVAGSVTVARRWIVIGPRIDTTVGISTVSCHNMDIR